MDKGLIKEQENNEECDEFEDNEKHLGEDGDYDYHDEIVECAPQEGGTYPMGEIKLPIVL